MHFSSITLSPSQLVAIRTAIGADRLAAYDTAVGGDRARAVDLYGWNAAVSAALFEPIHGGAIAKTGLDIAGMHQALLNLLDWIDHDVQHWATTYSRVPALLQNRP